MVKNASGGKLRMVMLRFSIPVSQIASMLSASNSKDLRIGKIDSGFADEQSKAAWELEKIRRWRVCSRAKEHVVKQAK